MKTQSHRNAQLIVFVALSLLCSSAVWAAPGPIAAWFSGSDTRDNPGVYGTQGVAHPDNIPGARNNCISWTNAGNLWLFGGLGYDAVGNDGELNDLWKFDGTNWTWVSGSDARGNSGIYGAQGVAHPDNIPGARLDGISWTDSAGNLWLFGGNGYDSAGNWGYLNDLWKYDGTNWTWVSGSNLRNQWGDYGTKGVADAANIPGARISSISWTDIFGNLWLFGGWGYDGSGFGGSDLNDLWKFDGTNWTWVSGSDTIDQNGVYGTKGVADAANIPGGRDNSVSWTDNAGNLWLFGGAGYGAVGNYGRLNDLWMFDGTEWTWVSGSDAVGQVGVYGTKGVADAANIPGGREDSISWTDKSGNLLLFGGYGYDILGFVSELNDLWMFDGTNWTWISGSDTRDQIGVYGTQGVAHPDNIPGARGRSTSWTDSSGNLWLFGGWGYDAAGDFGRLNDLWKFTFPGPDDCANAATVLFNQSVAGTTVGATGTDVTSCGTSDLNDVWYEFTPVISDDYIISLCGSNFDTTLGIFEDCGGSPSELACNDDSDACGGDGLRSQLMVYMAAGTTYWIRIAGYNYSVGEYQLTVGGCDSSLAGDLSGDCKVDLADVAILCENWLKCNLKPEWLCGQ